MPYFLDQNLEDEEKNKDPASIQISGASPTTNNEGSIESNTSPKGLNTGSGFQNLDKYLQTNQSQQFGNQVLGKVEGEVQGAKQGMETAGNQFKSQVSTSNQLPTAEQVNQAIANPTSANPQDFQKWESQTYSGPNSLADSKDAYNQYWSGANKANTSAQLLGSEPGRFTLLDSYFGKPSYSFGQKSLDNLLVQQSGLGSQIQGVQNEATQLKATGAQQAKDLQTAAAQRAAEVDANRKTVRGAIGLDDQNNVITGDQAGAIGKQYQTVDDELAKENSARQAQNQKFMEDLQGNSLSLEELNKLGIDPNQKIYGLDPSSYFTPGSDLNRDQVMAPDQRAYIQALSQLAGITDTYASGIPQDKGADFTYDTGRFQNDVGSAQAAYNREWNTAVAANPGEDPISYADMQTFINTLGSQPSYATDQDNLLKRAQNYQNRIDALNQKYQINRTISSNPSLSPGSLDNRAGPHIPNSWEFQR